MVVKVTADTFENEVLKSEIPVLLDCYADWCGPCKMMSPVVDKMAEIFDGKMKFCKLNVDEDGEAVMAYKVMSIPNFLFFKNGEVVHNAVGGMAPNQRELWSISKHCVTALFFASKESQVASFSFACASSHSKLTWFSYSPA